MDFEELRNKMVDEQIIGRGINDEHVIEAMRIVPRHKFVPESQIDIAYGDYPIPIGEGQTISQPYMVALMTQCLKLKKSDRVLEIGTGSGYQTAILAEIAGKVDTIERIDSLTQHAKDNLKEHLYPNINFYIGDGTLGFKNQELKFNAIIITAAMPNRLEHLLDGLSDKGRMVAPVGSRDEQVLTLFTKSNLQIKTEDICRCMFVPLVGKYGWN